MSIKDAMGLTGLCYTSLVKKAAAGEFEAYKPRGNKGGWEIDARSFSCWNLCRKMKTGNAPARAATRHELEEMGAAR